MMLLNTPKSTSDPTDSQGTVHPNESPASNSEQPPDRPLIIRELVGGSRLHEDPKSGDIHALISLFLLIGSLLSPERATDVVKCPYLYDNTRGVKQVDYWSQDPRIHAAMSRNRWKAIGEALHIIDPGLNTATVFGYVGASEAYLSGIIS